MTTEHKDLSKWMSRLPENLTKIPISELTIPGSHDTGTYGLTTEMGIAPDRPDLATNFLVRNLPCIALPMIFRWVKTQNLTAAQQLVSGIRYLDVRVGKKVDNIQLSCVPCVDLNTGMTDDEVMDTFHFIHGLYGPKLVDLLVEVNTFLDDNPKEIVFIDFQHFYAMHQRDHEVLIKFLSTLFKSKVCPHHKIEHQNTSKLNLEWLWDKKYQVFIYYRNNKFCPEQFWPSLAIPNPWANTINKSYLIRFLEDKMAERPEQSMYVTQCVLTPTNTFAYRNFKSSLLKKLAIPCNTLIRSWLETKKSGPKGPNIVMCDFVEWSSSAIPKLVISLNK